MAEDFTVNVPETDGDSLSGKTAIVTGASSGIGRQIAIRLAKVGINVVLASRNRTGLEATKKLITESPGKSLIVQTDVTSETDVAQLFRQTQSEYGAIDFCINNAGIAKGGPIEELDYSTWKEVLDVNLNGVFLCCREAFRIMKPQGYGRIINVGSVSAKMPRVHSSPYTTSKFALEGLTKCLALDGREFGITACVVQPGNTESALWNDRKELAEAEGLMSADDVAEVVLTMAKLPRNVALLEAVVLPVSMPFLGRG